MVYLPLRTIIILLSTWDVSDNPGLATCGSHVLAVGEESDDLAGTEADSVTAAAGSGQDSGGSRTRESRIRKDIQPRGTIIIITIRKIFKGET